MLNEPVRGHASEEEKLAMEAQNAEVKEKEERLSVPSLTAERVFQPGPTRAERISSSGVQAQTPRRVQVMDEAVAVDASQG